MRFLIVAAFFAFAAAAPSLPVGQRIEPTIPTISAGDINGAAIDAQVEVADHVRAAFDADRQLNDKVSEVQGQVVNNVEEQAWRVVDTVKTVEARLDGAAAGAAPIIAKNFVRGVATPGVAYAAQPARIVQGAAPIVPGAAPIVQGAAPVAPIIAPAPYVAAPVAYSAVPGPYAAAPGPYATAPVTYSAAPIEYVNPAYPSYPGYPGYPVYDSNSLIPQGFNQGFYPSPINYNLF